jgi:hypothetical protein
VTETLAQKKEVVLKEWLARTLQTYPFLTSRFMIEEQDRFRNPVGYAMRQTLPVLMQELVGEEFDLNRIEPVLREVMRIRAVQDFTPSEAVSFLFVLRSIVGRLELEDLERVHERIDQMAMLAFDLYMESREKIYEVKLNEAKRGQYVVERINGKTGLRQAAGAPVGQAGRVFQGVPHGPAAQQR